MAEPNSVAAWTTYGVLGWILSTLEPLPALGALFGCFFFLATPSPNLNWQQKTMLMLFSLGLGYSVGIGVSSIGGYERFAMLCAAAVSALGAGSFTSLHNYQNGGPIPVWLGALLDRLPFIKRGDGNG